MSRQVLHDPLGNCTETFGIIAGIEIEGHSSLNRVQTLLWVEFRRIFPVSNVVDDEILELFADFTVEEILQIVEWTNLSNVLGRIDVDLVEGQAL